MGGRGIGGWGSKRSRRATGGKAGKLESWRGGEGRGWEGWRAGGLECREGCGRLEAYLK